MNLEILQGGTVLRRYNHDGRLYAEAPPQGAYELRLTNNSITKRLAVVSVDGINVVSGDDASVDGGGYVMGPGETLTIPGWRRGGEKVAKFTFQPQEDSYANRVGKGVKNTGIIGVAVFDQKPSITNILRSRGGHGSFGYPSGSLGIPISANSGDELYGATMDSLSMSDDGDDGLQFINAAHDGSQPTLSATAASTGQMSTRGLTDGSAKMGRPLKRRKTTKSAAPVQLGTGYGKEVQFHTETTTFERATMAPALVIQMQYAVREQLVKWGIPVYENPPKPDAFPASPSVAPPPGWQASR
jgi:hypothetical protein